MVLAVGDARASAGWLLPLFCAGDIFAVVYYRGHAEARRLFSLFPWVMAGMAVGAVVLGAPEQLLRHLVGVIILLMIAVYLTRPRTASSTSSDRMGWQFVYGGAAGFTTMVANAAGPVMNVYLLTKRLPKEDFVATGAWFFLLVNLAKLPVYAYHGMIDARSLAFDFFVLPLLALGALSGRFIVERIPQRSFEIAVFSLSAAAALLLLAPPLKL
jgi:uncharacterized membrane protein YfcA